MADARKHLLGRVNRILIVLPSALGDSRFIQDLGVNGVFDMIREKSV